MGNISPIFPIDYSLKIREKQNCNTNFFQTAIARQPHGRFDNGRHPDFSENVQIWVLRVPTLHYHGTPVQSCFAKSGCLPLLSIHRFWRLRRVRAVVRVVLGFGLEHRLVLSIFYKMPFSLLKSAMWLPASLGLRRVILHTHYPNNPHFPIQVYGACSSSISALINPVIYLYTNKSFKKFVFGFVRCKQNVNSTTTNGLFSQVTNIKFVPMPSFQRAQDCPTFGQELNKFYNENLRYVNNQSELVI
eukprot:sb/3468870/